MKSRVASTRFFFLSQSEHSLSYWAPSCVKHMNHIPKLSLLSFCKNKTQTNDTRRDETNVESLSSTKLTSADTQKQKTSYLHVPCTSGRQRNMDFLFVGREANERCLRRVKQLKYYLPKENYLSGPTTRALVSPLCRQAVFSGET